jgi:hypothetical protein
MNRRPMANRTHIPAYVECQVLTECRRRCCLCVFLDNNHAVRPGQLAHIDQDRSNNKPENLAFLCLEHHDQYDAKTSQSKGLQEGELRSYVKQLHSLVISGNLGNSVPREFRVEHFDIESERCGWYRGRYAPEGPHEPDVECPTYGMSNGTSSNPIFLISVFNGTGRPQIVNRVTVARLELSQYCGGPNTHLVVPLETYKIALPEFRETKTEFLKPPIYIPNNELASFSISLVLPDQHFPIQYYELLFTVHAASGESAHAGPIKLGGMRVGAARG